MFTLLAWLGTGVAGVVAGLCGLRATVRRTRMVERGLPVGVDPVGQLDSRLRR